MQNLIVAATDFHLVFN